MVGKLYTRTSSRYIDVKEMKNKEVALGVLVLCLL
jgi:hypothetical protein